MSESKRIPHDAAATDAAATPAATTPSAAAAGTPAATTPSAAATDAAATFPSAATTDDATATNTSPTPSPSQPRLQRALMLSDKGYRDLKRAIFACTLTNFSLMLPFAVTILIIAELASALTGGGLDWGRLWLLFGAGVLSAVVVFFANTNDYRKTYVTSYLETANTRITVAERIRRLPMSVFNSRDLTDLTTSIMGDVATTEHVLSHILPQLAANAISITLISILLGFFDWRLALSIYATLPLSFAIIVLSYRLQTRLGKRQLSAKMKAAGQIQEYLDGIKVLKACNLTGARFKVLDDALLALKRIAIRFELGVGVFITGSQAVLQAGVGLTVFVGTFLIINQNIEFIPLMMFLVMVTRIYGPSLTELTLLPELLYNAIVVGRTRALMAIPVMEGADTGSLGDLTIRFEHVDFRYKKDGEKAVDDLTLTIPPGQITALVGPSGSGKSTVSRLMARFWDVDTGRVTIGGRNVADLDPEYLMSFMSFVFQDVVLFNDTVMNNIRIGKMDATEDEVMAAACAACCDEFVSALPQGYDTLLGENGATLSGGERQRISIARALLKDAPIVLLDEATASLDPENEMLIQQAITHLIAGKTVVVIAHRLRTIKGCPKIVVLDRGRLAQEGTHEELMQSEGLYHRLYTIQQQAQSWSVRP
ncbi:MAG: ABC transporter ATP-binding protein/permease [Coriobacteriales bacterium]|jgi:ATP-binding cassette subfamily B protein|nr:ABC transporter ATP-binding protein/permease [Coriobacteriales bacterium]